MIQTSRLMLRRARMTDLSDLHRVFSNEDAMRYWDSLPFRHLDQTRQFLTGMVNANPDHSDDFVIEYEGQVIGKAGCWGQGEIGFILHPDHWGQGIALEALDVIIPHVFEALALDRLTADVDPRNGRSLKLLERLGFQETGRAERTIQVGQEWCGSVYLELPRP